MNTAALASGDTQSLFSATQELFRREPLFAGTTMILMVLTLPLLVAHGIDARELLGVNIWDKPIKFAIALSVYLVTLAWFAGWLPKGTTDRLWYRIYSVAVVVCVIAEMIWIVGAATYGIASHFNVKSPFLQSIYSLMGMFAVMLTSASLVYGILIWRDEASHLNPAFRFSVALGLVMTFVTTVIVAGYMASGTGHLIGGSGTDVGGLALMGWSRTSGDLRVPHFFATHALHVLPIVGFVASRLLPNAAARTTVTVTAVGYAGLIGYAFLLSINGVPFIPMLRV